MQTNGIVILIIKSRFPRVRILATKMQNGRLPKTPTTIAKVQAVQFLLPCAMN